MISIHALREESDFAQCQNIVDSHIFQSTPSARRATDRPAGVGPVRPYFNPRPPRGGRRHGVHKGDYKKVFQSTPSARRATDPAAENPGSFRISIHALREEGDGLDALELAVVFVISIHALREEGDTYAKSIITIDRNFNPRPPRGGRLKHQLSESSGRYISIHALREEGDGSKDGTIAGGAKNFNPRPPRGGRQKSLGLLHKR